MNETRLSRSAVLGNGFGEIAYQVIMAVQNVLVVYFLYNYSGISGTKIAMVILIAGIWDAVNDPLMGILVDRTNTKMGKARPYLLFGSIPVAIFIIAVFFIPASATDLGKAIWVGVAYIGYGTFRTLVSVPYATMLVRITDSRDDRMRVTRVKTLMGMVGGLLVSLSFSVFAAGKANEGDIIAMLVAGFAIFYVLCNAFLVYSTKEIPRTTDGVKINPVVGVKALLKNKYWLRITGATLAYGIQGDITTALALFYLTSKFQAPGMLTPVMLFSFAAAVTGAITAKKFEKKVGLRNVALFGGILALVGALVRVILVDANIYVFIAGFAIAQFGYSYYFISAAPLLADTIEYGELTQGLRVEALASSSRTFADKVAGTIVVAGISLLLDLSGYIDATTGGMALVDIVQPQSAMSMLFFISAVIPIFTSIGLILCMRKFDVRQDVDELRAKKAAAEAAPVEE